MSEMTVVSEIYDEYSYKTDSAPSRKGNVISQFPFLLPKEKAKHTFDEDDDLDFERPSREVVKIGVDADRILLSLFEIKSTPRTYSIIDLTILLEHSFKTKIALVGLQVWRGAFLLGDLLIHLGVNGELEGKTILELGAGTGLTSFVAGIYAKKVVCTDIDLGGILDLIKINARCNSKLIKSEFIVLPLDFTNLHWNAALFKEIQQTDIIIAADVIYDDDVTSAFVSTVQKILDTNPPKTIYIVLEKRYVFTIEHMESIAPCYETFLALLDKVKCDWIVEQLPLNFPKYFTYDRVKELVLWKISSK